MKPRIAFIGTGGTLSSLGTGPLDILDYAANDTRMQADAILARFPEAQAAAEVFPVAFDNVPSPRIYAAQWRKLVDLCARLAAEEKDLAGIVIGHGTSTLEETAYVLSLTLTIDLPVVMVGSQRPASALSTDAGLNLVNAVRVAASPEARGMGVLVLLNDEIHAAREVHKSSTLRLHTFRSPDFGALGHADGDCVAFYRRPLRRHYPGTEFAPAILDDLPRVDIAFAYPGSDGTAVRAFLAAGAKGIVCAGFAPNAAAEAEQEPLREAAQRGVAVVISTRAGSGRVFTGKKMRESGFLSADNLNPEKARLLLALALGVTRDRTELERIFATY